MVKFFRQHYKKTYKSKNTKNRRWQFGDYKKLSDDISELRFTFGKGYRIYYTEENNKIILLINGGDKSKQSKDIEKAQELLEQWRIKND